MPAKSAATSPGPLTRAARHALVAEILERQPVRSQRELARLLAERGVVVTQATLSRDLDELGATKQRSGVGAPAYALTGGPGGAPRGGNGVDRLARVAGELLVAAEGAGRIAVLRTAPGGAHLLAAAVDRAGFTDVLGTVAGDDTLLAVCRTSRGGSILARRLLALAERRT